jgi:predicted anti-sigma-YlaC factor YlaD
VISCADFLAELGNYLEGEVATLVRLQLENHLAHCAMCRVVYDSSRKALRIVTESESFDLPEEMIRPVAENIMAKIREARK